MEYMPLTAFIFELLKSWQVIAVTVVILAYWGIINAVSNSKPPKPKAIKNKKEKVKRVKEPAVSAGKNVDDSELELGE
ncbi:MAG: hypothetical protein LBG72_07180 [Spirochaetaceae bacterium]|jgi:hypothetical protein|nr:hypothetical protein [Spirochaetaceae bacterium]